jgi:hypothetical protein
LLLLEEATPPPAPSKVPPRPRLESKLPKWRHETGGSENMRKLINIKKDSAGSNQFERIHRNIVGSVAGKKN